MTSPQDPRSTASPLVWPARPTDLVDTSLCLACFRQLTGPLCGFCGLDLGSPKATTLLELGRLIVDTEAARQSTITRMRAASAAARASVPVEPFPMAPAASGSPASWGAPSSTAPSTSVVGEHVSAEVPPGPASARPGTVAAPDGADVPWGVSPPVAGPPRRSSAQVLLLTAGVVLVSVFAIFFAVLAYVVASVETRSILTAAASLVVLGIAWFLRRRGLDGTAEGVAAIGVVLLLLDVWIIRVNRLFSVDTVDVSLYTGVAFLVVAAVLVGVSRLTALRAGSVSAAIIAPVGLFLLVFGATEPVRLHSVGVGSSDSESTRVLIAALVTALVVVAERIPRVPRVEAAMLRTLSIGAALVALLAAIFAFPSLEAGPTVGFALVSVIWLVYLVAVQWRRESTSPLRGRAWPVIGAVGLAMAVIGVASSAVIATADTLQQASGLQSAGMTVATALLLWLARLVPAPLARSLRTSGAVVAVGGALSLVPVLLGILPPLADGLAARAFGTALLEPIVDAEPETWWFVIGAAVTGATAFGALAALGSRRAATALAWVPVALAVLALLGAAVLAPSALATVAITILGATLLLAVSAWRRPARAARVAAFIGSLMSACSAAVLSGASSGAWLLSTLLVLGLLAAARLVARRAGRYAPAAAIVAAVLGTGLLLWIGALLPSCVSVVTRRPDASPFGFGVAFAAIVILGALAFAVRRTSASEVLILSAFAILALVPAVVSVWVTGDPVADAGWRLVLTGLAVAAAVAWLVLGRSTVLRAVVAGMGIALLTLMVADASVLVSAGSPSVPGSLAAAAFLSVLSAGVLVSDRIVRIRSAHRAVVTAVEWSVGASAAIVLVLAIVDGGPLTRLTLLVLAVVPTLVAFAAPEHGHRRRHIAWIGAALATAALWWFLADERVTVVEYYSLPVAGLLLAVGGVAGVADRRPRPDQSLRSRPSSLSGLDVLLAAGLAVAILPSGLAAAVGAPNRAVTTAVVGAALVTLALVVLRDHEAVRLRSIVWIAGVVAIALPVAVRLTGGRTTSVSGRVEGAADLALWLGSVVLVLLAAALGVSRLRRSPVLSDVAVIAALLAVGITVPPALTNGAISGTEASPWLLITCAMTVAAVSLDRAVRVAAVETVAPPPPPRRERPSARVAAVVGAVMSVGIAVTALPSADSLEWVSVPLGIAALAAGLIRLRRQSVIGSWPTLAPGLLLLLVPPLVYDLGDSELWRVIALGVASVAVTIAGARWRLQSPLVIGAVVTILHGFAQLWPWISGLYDAGYWWVWAGVGGVLLIAFAARYEQRMRALRAAGRALRALR
jgi:hypothetical protein